MFSAGRSRTRRLLVEPLALLAGLATAAVGPTSTAHAAPGEVANSRLQDVGNPGAVAPGGTADPVAEARMRAQQPLKRAAERIKQAVDAGAGYAGIVLEDHGVALYWAGPVPDAVEAAVTAARRSAPVTVRPARHSRAELEKAAAGVGRYLETHSGSDYRGVDVAVDGSGLTIQVAPGSAAALAAVTDTFAARQAPGAPLVAEPTLAGLPDGMQLPAGIAVGVETAKDTLTSRQDDSPPFWSGGRIRNQRDDEQCTAGWSVYNTGNGWNYMLTAAHCARLWDTMLNGTRGRTMGQASVEWQDHDLMLVSANVAGRMWDGGATSGQFSKAVSRWEETWPGEWLCTSGATTGAQCNYRVTNEFAYQHCMGDPYGRWFCYKDLVLADQTNGWTASQGGDSGGPVFNTLGADRVIAKGVIHGVRNNTTLIFQDFATAVRDFGINVHTN